MARAGRKKIAGVKRTGSGRRSRAAGAYQENIEPILTRMRHFGLSEKDARDQKAGTFVGRLQLTHVISQAQYDAAVRYAEIVGEHRRAIAAPDATRQSGGAGSGEPSERHAAWCRSAVQRYDAALGAVMAEQCIHENRGTNLMAALDYIVVRDEQMWHMVGDVRLALNALAHHLGIISTVRARSEAA